ncbi:coiled-coil domain-containing protein [Endozoicomonas euniceicola]|uniref:Uncharacterized protein n=1 Tax=Endozoicomonas euniceicola TaxID=1234143 RepID=A0ABY6GWE7_9GAMM|nr:hypothetical protein [Endozoicomonas euniceicola]UYM16396.1 hypothetical protein NX720_00230 [Endozoicomonas euniceicola]
MNRLGPKKGHSDVLQTTAKAGSNNPTPEKGRHNGQEVTYTEAPPSQSKASDKARALNQMPDLEQRQIDKLEQEMNLLRIVVETPDTKISSSRENLRTPDANTSLHGLKPDSETTKSSHESSTDSKSDVTARHSEPSHKTGIEESQPLTYPSKSSVFSSLISKIAKKIVASTRYLMDTKEIEESKKFRKAAKKQYEKARTLCVDTEKKIKTLEDKIRKLENQSGQLKIFNASRAKELQEKKAELAKQQQALPHRHEEAAVLCREFEKAVQFHESLTANGKKVIEPLSKFLASVRDFYAASHPKQGKPGNVRIDIPLDHLVLNTQEGKIVLDNVNVCIAGIDFVKGPGGKMCPVFKISELEATAAVDMPDGQVVKARVSARGIKAGLSGSAGQMLFNYTTAPNALSAGYGLLKEIGQITQPPNFVSLGAQEINVELPEFAPAGAASLLKSVKASPEPLIDALFRVLSFRLAAKLGKVTVATKGKLQADGELSDIHLDYRPEIPATETVPAARKGETPRRLNVQCGRAEGSINNALEVASELKEVLTPYSPFARWQNIALPLNQPPPYSDEPPPPYSAQPSDSPLMPDTETQPDPLKKPLKASDLMTLAGKTQLSASNINIDLTRHVEGAGTLEAHLSGNEHIAAKVEKLSIKNQGDLDARITATGINSHVTLTDGKPLSSPQGVNLRPAKLDAEVNIGNVEANINAPKGKGIERALGKDTLIRGELKLTTAKPASIRCIKLGDNLTVTGELPDLDTDVSQPFQLSRNGNGIHLPEGHVKLKGKMAVTTNKHITTIKPDLELNSDNVLEAVIDGQPVPLDLSTAVSIERTSPKLFVREDPETGVKTITPVISRGELNFNRLKAGPVTMGQVKVVLDGENFGAVHITEAEVNLRDVTKLLYPPSHGSDAKTKKNPIIKWLIKRATRHQRLMCDAQLKIVGGAVDLKQLDKVDLKVAPTSRSRIDRFFNWVLNKMVQRHKKQLLQFSLAIEHHPIEAKDDSFQVFKTTEDVSEPAPKAAYPAPEESESDALEPPEFIDRESVRTAFKHTPVLKLPSPIGIEVPLPLPADCIQPDAKALSLSSLLRQNTGALVVSKRDVEQLEKALQQIDAGNPVAISYLVGIIEQHHDNASLQGLVHLVAKQLPIKAIEKLFNERPEIKESIAPELLICADKLLSHPELCIEATQLCQLAGQPFDIDRIEQVIEQAETNPQINLTGLARLLEMKFNNPLLAKSCYEKALERNPSDPLANRCLGKLLLREQSRAFSFNDVHAAFEHLITAWQAGDRTIRHELEQLETFYSQELDAAHNAIITRAARLRLAMVCLEEEKDHHDFTEAMTRLLELANQQADPLTQQQAIKLIEHRRSTGDLIFHTSDPDVYQTSQQQLEAASQYLRKLDIKALQPFARELGIKCLYGSHGVVQNLDLAMQLLIIADSQEDQQARFHLRLAERALKSKQQKSYDKLRAAAAAAV